MPKYLAVRRDGKKRSTHRVVVEEQIGRPLTADEHVHHVNDDRRDNRPENLKVMSPAEHARHHNQKHPVVKVCEHCGSEYEPSVKHRGRSRSCSWACRNALIAAAARERESRKRTHLLR